MDHIERLVMFVMLFLAQVLILNHIHLLQVATPLLYIYFVITFRRGTPKWMCLSLSFVMGLLLDIFTNTPGIAAGSMTLIAFLQPYILESLVPRDSAENMEVSAATLGVGKFALISVILVTLYCIVFFSLEAFTFFNWQLWFFHALGSIVITLVLVAAVETIRSR